MIRSLEKELSGVEVKEVVTSVAPLVASIEAKKEEASTPIEVPNVVKEEPSVIEEPLPTPEPQEPPKVLDEGGKLFEELMVKLYDRNYDLGECFKDCILYSSSENNFLTWESSANKEQKTLLKNNWMTIRTFVQEIFGFETKIKNVSKELPSRVEEPKPIANEPMVGMEEPISMIEDELLNQPVMEQHPSMPQEEEMPMKSSCIAPEAAKEKDERTILDEPMVAKALELFSPKKVRVKRKA
jgi:DNA polymerase-3 subunit gamma/tau